MVGTIRTSKSNNLDLQINKEIQPALVDEAEFPDSEDPDASDVYDLTQKVKQMAAAEIYSPE